MQNYIFKRIKKTIIKSFALFRTFATSNKNSNTTLKHLTIKILIIVCCFFPAIILHAQRERNLIYMVDATPAMNKSDNLWKDTRKWIENDIKSLYEGRVTIIPFQKETFQPISFDTKEITDNQLEGVLRKIENELERLMQNKSEANLYNALKVAVKHIENKKDNFIYILTNSTVQENDAEALCRFIRNWCTMKPDNVQVFYITLSQNSYNEKIAEAVKRGSDIFSINAKGHKLKPICAFMPREIVVNLQDMQDESRNSWPFGMLSRQEIHCSKDGPISISASTDDSLFRVQNKIQISNAYGSVNVMPISPKTIEDRLSGLNDYHFDIRVKVDSHEVWLVTDSIHVRVVNKPERILYLPLTWFSELQIQHYPKFLFWKANRPDTLHVNLKDFMNKEARQNNATALFQVSFDDIQESDFQLFFNGIERADKTFMLDSNTTSSQLDIVFSENILTGSHQLALRCLSSERLDRINALSPEKLYQSQLIDYKYGKNPLAYLLVIFCMLLIVIPPSICLISRKFTR